MIIGHYKKCHYHYPIRYYNPYMIKIALMIVPCKRHLLTFPLSLYIYIYRFFHFRNNESIFVAGVVVVMVDAGKDGPV